MQGGKNPAIMGVFYRLFLGRISPLFCANPGTEFTIFSVSSAVEGFFLNSLPSNLKKLL